MMVSHAFNFSSIPKFFNNVCTSFIFGSETGGNPKSSRLRSIAGWDGIAFALLKTAFACSMTYYGPLPKTILWFFRTLNKSVSSIC